MYKKKIICSFCLDQLGFVLDAIKITRFIILFMKVEFFVSSIKRKSFSTIKYDEPVNTDIITFCNYCKSKWDHQLAMCALIYLSSHIFMGQLNTVYISHSVFMNFLLFPRFREDLNLWQVLVIKPPPPTTTTTGSTKMRR